MFSWTWSAVAVVFALSLAGGPAAHQPPLSHPLRIEPAASATERPHNSAAAARPLAFVKNAGQLPPTVKFYAQAGGASVFFTEGEAVFKFVKSPSQPRRTTGAAPPPALGLALAMRFVGANRAAVISGRTPGMAKWNHMVGSDPTQWRTNLPTWNEVVYQGLWPGIDAVFTGRGGEIKYEFVVQPGADAAAVAFQYAGASGLKLDAAGNLVIETGIGPLHDAAPVSYQEINSVRVPVESRYVLRGKGQTSQVGIEVSHYDRTRPLVIDPALTWAPLSIPN